MTVCARCDLDRPETDFRRRPDRRNVRVRQCKTCEREIQLDNYYRSKDADPLLWRARVMRNNRSPHITLQWLDETLTAQGGEGRVPFVSL